MSIKKDGIVVLLGAGCSKEAGIPTSMDMITEIEKLIEEQDLFNDENLRWGEYKDLYNYIKSSIFYAEGIKGDFGNKVNYNIERLVNTLAEIEKKEDHTIYPFIGNWNIKLIEMAGYDFRKVKGLKERIVEKLKEWVTLKNYTKSQYYSKLFEFQDEYTFPLKVFTLNYDLCVEKNTNGQKLERGFDEERKWDWRRFEENDNTPVDIYLYKMHGSIDWERDENGNLTFSDEVSRVATPNLIFGTTYKLQYIDPYLFFAYEFRRYSLESQLIITIGYGFGDEHINGIIGQALNSDPQRKILSLIYKDVGDNQEERERIEREEKDRIKEILKIKGTEQIELKNMGARQFMETELKIERLATLLPQEEGFQVLDLSVSPDEEIVSDPNLTNSEVS
jgi:hypothetical protein